MIFHSTQLPGAAMNRFGIVFLYGRQATPRERGVVLKEAAEAGCQQVPHENPDIGLVWVNPNPTLKK